MNPVIRDVKVDTLPVDGPISFSVYHEGGEILFHHGVQISRIHISCLQEAGIKNVITINSEDEKVVQNFQFDSRTIPFDQKLTLGQVLDRDIVSSSGSVILPTGSPVTDLVLDRIMSIGFHNVRLSKLPKEMNMDQVDRFKQLVEKLQGSKTDSGFRKAKAAGNTILVVEDDARIRRILVHYFSEVKYTVVEAENGQQGLEIIKNNPAITLVVTDVNMPNMNGFELCREIKQIPEKKHIPVLLCTARNTRDDILIALKEGANDFVVKPFTKEALIGKVRRLLQPELWSVHDDGERRKDGRYNVKAVVSWGPFEKTPIGLVFNAPVANISLTGLCFKNYPERFQQYYPGSTVPTTHPFYDYAKINSAAKPLKLYLQAEIQIFDLSARVVYVRFDVEQACEMVGIEFVMLPAEAKSSLTKLFEDTTSQ